jgi:DNA adenine methylase
MKYMGSKARIAKHILPIILRNRKEGQWYVEPFVGGANLIDKVDGNRIGADCNHYLVGALKLIQLDPDLLPPDNIYFNENDYKYAKNYGMAADGMHGYIGFALSYSGKWWGGWCRDGAGKRDYVAEAFRNAQKQSPKLKGVKFLATGYPDLVIPRNSIIYCDPPYAGTTKYKDDFDHESFWHWCRSKAKQGHAVFVSEYNAPEDFECVWQKEIVSSLTKDTGGKKGIEKLFVLKGTSPAQLVGTGL